jgi:prepilin signal peptidase PulO-like enzyme (type II secretory pathway)
MIALFCVFVFLFGASIGSFINAMVYRLRHEKPIVADRSKCVHCSRVLQVADLIPVLSYVCLRGRCRTCLKPIPDSYVTVELAAASLFLFAFLLHVPVGSEWWDAHRVLLLIRDWSAIAILLFLFVYDLMYMLLPDEVTLPAIAVFALMSWCTGVTWQSILLGTVVGGGFFLLQYLVSSGRWIGGGDIRFGAMMGALLGWPLVLVGLFLSYMIGAVVAVSLLVSGKKKLGQNIPFGTFLAIGTLATLWWGRDLLVWYLRFL